MTIVDIVVYFIIFVAVPVSIYLKKTGKTFKEMMDEIIEFFNGLGE